MRCDPSSSVRLRPGARVGSVLMFATLTTACAMHAQSAALRQFCAADYRTYCQGVRLGGGRALACLRENAPRLSPQCQQALIAARAARQSSGG